MTLELVLLTPVIVALLCLGVGLARIAYGRQLVETASAAAARAASLSSTSEQARAEARRMATESLKDAGLSCRGLQVDVDVSAFGPGGEVVVTLECTAALDDLLMSGLPGAKALNSSSRSSLERYRDYGGTGP